MGDDDVDLDSEITRKTWYKFIPLLKRMFLTYSEYHGLIRNVHYLKGNTPIPGPEDGDFMLYIMIRNKELPFNPLKLDYKTFFKLYLYIFGENYLPGLSKREKDIYG